MGYQLAMFGRQVGCIYCGTQFVIVLYNAQAQPYDVFLGNSSGAFNCGSKECLGNAESEKARITEREKLREQWR